MGRNFISNFMCAFCFRNDGVTDRYSVLMKFDSQGLADDFYRHYNLKPFSSMEVCSFNFLAPCFHLVHWGYFRWLLQKSVNQSLFEKLWLRSPEAHLSLSAKQYVLFFFWWDVVGVTKTTVTTFICLLKCCCYCCCWPCILMSSWYVFF
jgi:hypothetical protein